MHLHSVSTSQKTYHPVDDRALCFRFPGWAVIFLYSISYVLADCRTQIPTQWMLPSPPGHDSEQTYECVEPHLHFSTCLWDVPNYAHEWRFVRVTYLPFSSVILISLVFTHHFPQPDLWYDIFVICNWVNTWWQWYSTHLHANNTWNNTNRNNT